MLIANNKVLNRFETEIHGEFAHLDYEFLGDIMNLYHTFVPRKTGIRALLLHWYDLQWIMLKHRI